MILWRNIEFFSLFIILIQTLDFPHVYYMLGGNLGSLLYGDVSVMQMYSNRLTVYADLLYVLFKLNIMQCNWH